MEKKRGFREKKKNVCFPVIKWIVQSMLWVEIALMSVFHEDMFSFETRAIIVLQVSFVVLYVTHLIFCFFYSQTWKLLVSRKQKLEELLKHLYSSYPKITLTGKTYAVDKEVLKKRRKESRSGSFSKKPVHYKVHSKNFQSMFEKEFKIYSSKDVSEEFKIETLKNKRIVKLDLQLLVTFDDTISILDYENCKAEFWSKHKKDNNEFLMSEEIDFDTGNDDNSSDFNLVFVGERPFLIQPFFYVLFSVLALIQVYKIYFNSLCMEQSYTLKKLISTRYDLNTQLDTENKNKSLGGFFRKTSTAIKRQSSIFVNNQVIVLELDEPGPSVSFSPEKPSAIEIHKAKKYENFSRSITSKIISSEDLLEVEEHNEDFDFLKVIKEQEKNIENLKEKTSMSVIKEEEAEKIFDSHVLVKQKEKIERGENDFLKEKEEVKESKDSAAFDSAKSSNAYEEPLIVKSE